MYCAVGGPFHVENLLFCVPNTGYNKEINGNQVLINSSLFVQKFNGSKFDEDNKISIKFWIKMPNGIGFIKKPWYMRTELIFENVNNI
jgi:hypothetical protein